MGDNRARRLLRNAEGAAYRAAAAPLLGRLPAPLGYRIAPSHPSSGGSGTASTPSRHQVWEISAPVPVEGETAMVFGRCAAEVSATIRRSPAHWESWVNTGDLTNLGLIRPQRDRPPAAGPVLLPDGDSYTMDQQIASRLGADLFLPHAPSAYRFPRA